MPSASLQSILVPGRVARFGARAFGEFLVWRIAEDPAHCTMAASVSDKFRIYAKRFDRIARASKWVTPCRRAEPRPRRREPAGTAPPLSLSSRHRESYSSADAV